MLQYFTQMHTKTHIERVEVYSSVRRFYGSVDI